MVNHIRLIDLFKQLCLVNSPALNEAEIVKLVVPMLQRLGMRITQDDAGQKLGGNANNVLAVLPGNGGLQRPFFFSAHFDTVEPTEGLVIVEANGVISTDGTTILGSDDKAGLAALIEMVSCLVENSLPHGQISLLLSVAEEIGLKGAALFDCSQVEADFGYVLDTSAPVGKIVVSAPSHDVFTMTITGKAAHAGMQPEQGISAIQAAAKGIASMRLGRIDELTTANVGVISGGNATNVVCEQVVIKAESRSRDAQRLAEQTQHMIDCMQLAVDEMGATLSVKLDHEYTAYNLDPEHPLVVVARHAMKQMGIEPVLFHTGGGADANIYNSKGLPCTVLSCAMHNVHTHQECCHIDQLVASAELVLRIATSEISEAYR